MSGRFVTTISMAVLLALATALAPGAAQAQPRDVRGRTVIIKCAYLSNQSDSDPGLETVVKGIETTGPVDPRLEVGISCAQAFNMLFVDDFTLLLRGPTVSGDFNGDGVVDAADYVVWRSTH